MAIAKDIMTGDPVTLQSSMDIKSAVEIFTTRKFSSIPVVDSMGGVAGQLSELVLVRILVLHQLQPDKFVKVAHCQSYLEEAVFVEPTDQVASVLKAILKSPSRRVLVQNQTGKIIGIISPKDLIRALTEGDKGTAAIQTAVEEIIQPQDKK